ncbi:unnamed protein product [Wuchereria bancrofti]|uniref:Uncharacterized protein n=1 Tax=Wuchereria bancrofti TaxID=6293 RepID=A0A3P7FDC7_WUCBA|nr:unnamed protein product [Wuchereria bancrofti]
MHILTFTLTLIQSTFKLDEYFQNGISYNSDVLHDFQSRFHQKSKQRRYDIPQTSLLKTQKRKTHTYFKYYNLKMQYYRKFDHERKGKITYIIYMAACFLKDFVERYTLLRTSWWLKRPMRNRQVQLQQKVSLSVLAAAVLRTFS